jgi:hypothetical protein
MPLVLAWITLIGYQAYQHGVKQNKMPEPYYFFWSSIIIGFAGVISIWHAQTGYLFAWASVLGAFAAKVGKADPNTESIPISNVVQSTSGSSGGFVSAT